MAIDPCPKCNRFTSHAMDCTLPTDQPVGISLEKPFRGFNGCMVKAAEALRFLADNKRPSGGQYTFNSEHLYQLAKELEITGREIESRPMRESVDLETVQQKVKDTHGQLLGDIFVEAGDCIDGDNEARKRVVALNFIDAMVKTAVTEIEGGN